VKWVWTINSTDFDSRVLPWQPLYPGDAYVDVIGIDAYNNDPNFYRSFSSMFDATYDSVVAANTIDAIWIAETGSVEGTSSTQKADWIRNAFFVALPERFPRVRQHPGTRPTEKGRRTVD
jgi:beta-mannanase